MNCVGKLVIIWFFLLLHTGLKFYIFNVYMYSNFISIFPAQGSMILVLDDLTISNASVPVLLIMN